MTHSTVTHAEALRRLLAATKLIDYADCKDETVWQALGAAQGTAEGVLRDEEKPFAYFVQPSSFGPFIECKPGQVGAFAAYRTAQPAVVAVPEGFALVPKQPTAEMVNTLAEGNYSISVTDAYIEMLKIAPQPAAAPSGDVVAWRVTGNYTDQPFKDESSADAYLSGLIKSDPDGGYKKTPLYAAITATKE